MYCVSCGHGIDDHLGDSGCLALNNDDRDNHSIDLIKKRICSCMMEYADRTKKVASKARKRRIVFGPKRKLWEILQDVPSV